VREYFTSGGATPWWLLGTSMVATTFAADTPLTLAGWVVTKGIAQNWFWWCQIPVVMLGVFFIARLWRRAGLVTDTELVYLRYSGRAADVLRGFKALYLSLVYGCIVMGWVNLAMTKIIRLTVPDIPRVPTVDEACLYIYLHTPLSNELPADVRNTLRTGRLDPLHAYYEDWRLHRAPQRLEVMNELDVVFRRMARYHALAAGSADQTDPAFSALRTYLATLEPGTYLARLNLANRTGELATWGTERTASELPHLAALEGLCGVNVAVSGVNKLKIILLLFVIVMSYTAISGLWGVLITDFIQFWIAMAGCTLLAVLAVHHAGGLDAVLQQMAALYTPEKARGMLSLIPVETAGDLELMPWSHFLAFVLFVWYVAGLTDGGSYFAQRMLAAKDERHAALGYLWYAIAHFCLRMWPWLVVGVVAAVLFPYTRDALTGQYPGQAEAESGYVRVMLAVLPSGLLGLLLATFLAAYMSTISTQLNLGASYLLNDFYRPFLRRHASEGHYVLVSQGATVLMAAIGLAVSLFYESISDAWFLIGTLGAGTGFVYLLRWFWWRVNAWTEIACLGALLLAVIVLKLLRPALGPLLPPYPLDLLILVPYSVGVGLLVTYLTPPVATERLLAFYRRVQPGGPGWRPVERLIRQSEPDFVCHSPLTWANLRRGLLGSVAVYCALFGTHRLILGRPFENTGPIPPRWVGALLLAVALALGWVVARSLSAGRWTGDVPSNPPRGMRMPESPDS